MTELTEEEDKLARRIVKESSYITYEQAKSIVLNKAKPQERLVGYGNKPSEQKSNSTEEKREV